MTGWEILAALAAWAIGGAVVGCIVGKAATIADDPIFTDEDARW